MAVAVVNKRWETTSLLCLYGNIRRNLTAYEKLDEKIKQIELQLAGLPKGKLYCARNGKYYKWYRYENDILTYIPKKDKELAKQLAAKNY